MRRFHFIKVLPVLCFCLILLYIYSIYNKTTHPKPKLVNSVSEHIKQTYNKKVVDRVVISFVVCDSRFNESLNVIKSVLLFTQARVYFVIFADDVLRPGFEDTLTKWKNIARNFDFELQRINFPDAHKEEWLNLFSKCAAQRLFIPALIPHIDAMIYVDTDTLFLGPAEDLWDFFSQFNSSQISAMTLEDDNPNISWYPRFAKHPYFGKYGLNSGVMLMNLTRMRDFGWVDYVTPIMLKWKLYIPWGDQDIINIIFHYHGDGVLELPCRCNYRPDQCMYGDACAGAGAGALVLHGSRRAFHNNKQPAFQAIYKAVDEYNLGEDPKQLLIKMNKYFDEAPPSNCGNVKDAFMKLPLQSLKNTGVIPDR